MESILCVLSHFLFSCFQIPLRPRNNSRRGSIHTKKTVFSRISVIQGWRYPSFTVIQYHITPFEAITNSCSKGVTKLVLFSKRGTRWGSPTSEWSSCSSLNLHIQDLISSGFKQMPSNLRQDLPLNLSLSEFKFLSTRCEYILPSSA